MGAAFARSGRLEPGALDAPWGQGPNLPWSVWTDGKPGGSQDKDSLEPDKAAWFGTSYLRLYDVTKGARYLDAARAIARTLAATQAEDGSWPFRVVPQDGRSGSSSAERRSSTWSSLRRS
jgi:hypothetical protein